MEINKTLNENTLTVTVSGRLNTLTAPQLEEEIKAIEPTVACLVMDFADVPYISSAGLRVLLEAQKKMAKQGKMVVRNVCEDVKEVLDITGFSDILTIE
ncbi:MAG: STAS domain-containing protein [Erysipelotrichaceae bacterium]|nr:STAS domain-containing protein [Erysipelotrichaceae bacterium]